MHSKTVRKSIHLNFPIIINITGLLLIIEGLFMLIPIITAVIYGERDDMMSFLTACAITISCGCAMSFIRRAKNRSLGKRDGILLTSVIWCVFSLFGMIPFLLSTTPLSLTDAFFETISGFTTTGATVYPDVEVLPYSINIWRCLTQWIGGLGIVLFTLAVLPMFNHAGGMQMYFAEVTEVTQEKIRPRINQTAMILWAIYGLLTIVLSLLLWAGSGNFFHSLCHAFSTMSTGGFSTTNGSDIFVNNGYGKLILTIFMFLGGVNFSLLYRATMYDGIKTVIHDEVLRTYCKIIGICFVIFLVAALVNSHFSHWYDAIIDPLFQVVSTVTSTGFTVQGYNNWGEIVPGVMLLIMSFGACAGSTTGGIKIDRVLFILKNSANEFYRTIHPNAIRSVRINGTVMSRETINRVMVFIVVYIAVVAVSGILLTTMGVPVGEAMFDTYSCVSNNGLSISFAGIEGGEYVNLPVPGKWLLAFVMMAGRLELFSVLVIFTTAFWRK